MKKRLRKKYRVGEFQQLCFTLSFDYKGDVDSQECADFLHALVNECIEANGMNCDGHLTDEGCHVTLTAIDPTQTNQEQIDAVKSWVAGRKDIEVKGISELEDLWYGGIC